MLTPYRRCILVMLVVFACLVNLVSPTLASNYLLLAETFDWYGLDHWRETFNGQLLDSSLPCRSRNSDRISWKIVNGQAKLDIDGSTPCKVVLQPELYFDLPNQWQVRFTFQPLQTNADYNWLIKWQNQDNYLGFHLFNNWLYPEKKVNGVSYPVLPAQQYFPIKKGQIYQVVISYDERSQTTTVQVNDQAAIEFSEDPADPVLSSGLPGLAGSVGAGQNTSTVVYDNWQLWELESTNATILEVPLLKQTDSRWADEEYNSALSWSPKNPNFGRWGCAVTSAAMVFQYFGLNSMPTGHPVNPATLNTWLKTQADGYVAEGLVNWRALSRLSWQMHKQQPTPALEFAYAALPNDPLNWLQVQLWRQMPVILAQPGHFVVAHGVTDSLQVMIRDPYYPYSNLQPYQNSWSSARVFTPSQTDLSAITIWTQPGITITRSDLDLVPIQEFYPQGEWWVYDIPKPGQDNYLFEVSNYDLAAKPIQIMVYDPIGNVTQQELIMPAQTAKYQVMVELNTDSPAQISWNATSPLFSPAELVALLRRNELGSPLLIEQIRQRQAELSQSPSQEKATASFNQSLNIFKAWYSHHWLTHSSQEILTQQLLAQVLEAWP